jgi:hypothetical protein
MRRQATRFPAAALARGLVLVLIGSGMASAQKPAEPLEVTLTPYGTGQAAFLRRTATAAGDVLSVTGLEMTRHALIGVEPVEPGAPLAVTLHKMGVAAPARTGTPDAQGSVLFAFRTYDEVAIQVKAEQPTDYRVAILVSPPIEAPVPSPFVPAQDARSRSSSSLVAGAAAGVLVLGALAFFVLRRRDGRGPKAPAVGAALVAVMLAGAVLVAAGPGGGADPSPAGGADTKPPSWPPTEKGTVDASKGISDYTTLLGKLLTLYDSLRKLNALTDQDLAFEPQLAPPGMPQLPLGCNARPEGSARFDGTLEECGTCYRQAFKDLSDTRKKLENNRIVLANFTRKMNATEEAGKALGGMHGGLGVIFLGYKAQWDADRATIYAKYDERYADLIKQLRVALADVAACEQAAYHNASWYDRYGFMYYEFMAARYKRAGMAM